MPTAVERFSRSRLSGWAAPASVMMLAVALSAVLVDANNPDVFWHLRTGQWIVATGAVPRMDMFRFGPGQEWIDSQWLFQVVLYGFQALAGEAGPSLLAIVLTAGLAALMMAAAVGVPREARALVGFGLLLAISPRLYCRPELLSCLDMAALFFLLERARHRPLLLLPCLLVQLLFANS